MSFEVCPPRPWRGRYARIPGDTTAFHVRDGDRGLWPYVDWEIDDELAHCPMVESRAALHLAHAVRAGKRALGGSHGGSFLINEFGDVLVPSFEGNGRVVVVGRWRGPLRFHDRHHPGLTFDLADDNGLHAGEPWALPYVGLPYHLSAQGEIYFWGQDELGAGKITPTRQDTDLIRALRRIRPSGAVRFVVSCGGLALTKVDAWRDGISHWEARYVGRLNFQRWFHEGG